MARPQISERNLQDYETFCDLASQLGDYMMCNARTLSYDLTDKRFTKDFTKFEGFNGERFGWPNFNLLMGSYGSAGNFIRSMGCGIQRKLNPGEITSENEIGDILGEEIPVGMGRNLNLAVAVLYSLFLNSFYNASGIEEKVMESQNDQVYEKGVPLKNEEIYFLLDYLQKRKELWDNIGLNCEDAEAHKRLLTEVVTYLAQNTGVSNFGLCEEN